MSTKTKSEATPPPLDRATSSALVKVRVVKQPICEEGIARRKGEVFEVTEERARALGDYVLQHNAKL